MLRQLLSVVALFLVLLLVGCSQPPETWIGKTVKVWFRGGADASAMYTGELIDIDRRNLYLKADGKDAWIPRDAVQCIEVQ